VSILLRLCFLDEVRARLEGVEEAYRQGKRESSSLPRLDLLGTRGRGRYVESGYLTSWWSHHAMEHSLA
jgi:hypothetical protein